MNESRLCPSCQQLLVLSQDLLELAANEAAYQTLATALECPKDHAAIESLLGLGDTTTMPSVSMDSDQPDRLPWLQRFFLHHQPSILKFLTRRVRLEVKLLQAKVAKFQPL